MAIAKDHPSKFTDCTRKGRDALTLVLFSSHQSSLYPPVATFFWFHAVKNDSKQ